MPYKTILVHANLADSAPDRIRLAARLALAADAHLIGSALSGISRFIPPDVLSTGGSALRARCAALRDDAVRSLERFGRIAREEGVPSAEARLVDDDVDGGLAMQARYCDLAVVGQAGRGASTPAAPPDLPQYLLFTSGRPVLVVPWIGCRAGLDGGALVAWDGSVEATRAVTGALPLLRMAGDATILAFGEAPARERGDDGCAGLAAWLARHGVKTSIGRRPDEADIGAMLLSEATDSGASLLVMGGYGHSRLREALAKGVTATILRSMTLPVLMAH